MLDLAIRASRAPVDLWASHLCKSARKWKGGGQPSVLVCLEEDASKIQTPPVPNIRSRVSSVLHAFRCSFARGRLPLE
jgi:hypothetical protein